MELIHPRKEPIGLTIGEGHHCLQSEESAREIAEMRASGNMAGAP
jgi:hypothetical protein